MNEDVADGLLLDLRGVDIAELLIARDDEEAGLAAALKRILETNTCNGYCSFTSSI
jgi:hypothetical protein